MNTCIKSHSAYGRCLYAENGVIELYIPLDFGIRIGHLSFIGEKNVFFVQPQDMQLFTTEKGWRIRGGHRLWLAPESEKVYSPDNAPIDYQIVGENILLTQKEDNELGLVKRISLKLQGNRVYLTHKITNVKKEPFVGSLWAITVMDKGGIEYIKLNRRDGGFDALHSIALWDYTNLGDERASYERDSITLKSLDLDAKYKIGVRHPVTPISYELDGVIFKKYYQVQKDKSYPDSGVSYETFMSKYMTEMESLSPLVSLGEGESAEHEEIWELERSQKKEKV